MTQPFDTHRLELMGEPVTVVDHIGLFRDYGFFSASTNDVLVYRTGDGVGASHLAWFDREGRVLGTAGEPGSYVTLALSPDGARAAVSRLERNAALWLLDFSRGTSTRFTFGPSATVSGTWSPDGNRIVFASNRNGVYDLYQKPASGAEDEELLLKSSGDKHPTSWSRDGRFLLYEASDPKAKTDLWMLPLQGDQKPFPFLHTEFNNSDGQFSPDGRSVAYRSDESGRDEVYVRTFLPNSAGGSPDAGGKWLISTDGGMSPRWRRDGKMLYYVTLDGKLMAVEVTANPGFQAGVPKVLFLMPERSGLATAYQWDAAPDGKRFLFPALVEQGTGPFTVVLNWQAGLKK